ncbi:MAG: beta-propeller fold lactonase family protein, partial [Candidatus Eremiobacteraeota bacterium]|nr:beta-propeller fold lactonase family protein [Candidatus Eremiobacteraeota bacterium]
PGPAASVVGPGGPTPVGESRYLYTISSLASSVVGYRVDPVTGQLFPVATARFAPQQSTPEALVVVNHHVYAAESMSGAVNAFNVQADGRLEPIQDALGLSGGPNLVGLRATPNGQNLFALATNPTAIYSLKVDTSGAISQNGPPLALPGGLPNTPSPLCVDPQGAFVFVCNNGQVTSLRINADGTLTTVGSFAGAGGATAVTTDRSGSFLYTADRAQNVVSQFSIARATGALSPLATATIATPTGPQAIALDPAGPFLYVGTDSGQVAAFSIGATGQLTSLGQTAQQPGLGAVVGLEVDAAGRAVYVRISPAVNLGFLSHVPINADGSLGQLQRFDSVLNDAGGEMHFDNGTQAVAVTPKNVYTANAVANTVSSFAINPTTGALTPLNTVPSLSNEPRALAVATLTDGTKVLYLATFNSLNVFHLAPDGSLGAALPLNLGSPSIVSMAVSSSNRFLYVLDSNPGGNSFVVILAIQNDGTLVPTSSLADTGLPGARKIKVDPRGGQVYVSHAQDVVTFTQGLGATLVNQGPTSLGARNVGITDLALNPRLSAVGAALNLADQVVLLSHVALGLVGSDPPVAVGPARAVAFDPAGTNLYVTVDNPPSLSLYRVADNRTLSLVPGQVAVGAIPAAISTDESGRFFYLLNVGTNTISQFGVNANGTVSSLTPAFVATGNGPSDMLVVSDRR